MSLLRTITAVALLTGSLSAVQAQTLFTYGPKQVSKEEFLKAYNKNNTESAPTAQSYRDYLDLYTRFKIKVQAALALKLDTLNNQKEELATFRSQVVESYMNDEASVGLLVEEAMDRSQKDLHIAHIFVAAGPSATEEQLKRAEQKIKTAYEWLQKGEDFTKAALTYSEDPNVQHNKGDLGYITAFVLPYEMETVVYSTPTGKYSAPLRSKNGFHIFKNLGARPAIGRMRAAQILLAFPPDATDAQKQEIGARADSLYRALQQGSNFKTLVAAFSSDNLSFQTGGEMMAFGVGRYTPVFENAVFSLDKDSAISRPILTEFGYHIVKRLQLMPVPNDKANKQWQEDIKQQVFQSDRMEVSKKVLNKKILQLTGFKKVTFNEKSVWQFTDNIMQGKGTTPPAGLTTNTVLFSIGKQSYKLKDWQLHIESLRGIANGGQGKTNAQLFDQFIDESALDYYRQHLETYNKDFAWQLNEFKEGNLLFEIMQRKIWDKASADSVGLKKFYQAHKDKYWWEASADAIIFTVATPGAAEEVKKKLEADYHVWKKLVETSDGTLQADSSRFELGQIPVLERTNFQPGLITASVKSETDSSLTFAYIIKVYRDREPRNFGDARGFVINDYQSYLEDQWIAELKKKYPVKINEAVVKSLPIK
jgi:peptidyl-prolyl cis-trans isomerase SurA